MMMIFMLLLMKKLVRVYANNDNERIYAVADYDGVISDIDE